MINWPLFFDSLPDLLKGSLINIQIASGSLIIGLLGAVPLALAEKSGHSFFKSFSIAYSALFRGTPIIVQIMFVYYVLPQLGCTLPPLLAVILAMGMNSAAYLSQIIRTGLLSISQGQLQASLVLGISSWQTYHYIIFPQCFRRVLPSLGNELTTLLKDSSLASVVGIVEIVKVGSIIRGRTFEAFTVLLGVGLVYLALVGILTLLIKSLEKKARKPCSL